MSHARRISQADDVVMPRDLGELAELEQGCRRCDLFRHATQAVPGRGRVGSLLMLVGEQPGDEEDLRGEPFVGPAGRVLRSALAEVGLATDQIYVTNAVKHFKFVPRGKRRMHQRPNVAEIAACNVWLAREVEIVAPRLIVALGATAARALLGRSVTVGSLRGRLQPFGMDRQLLVTVHPSYLLRIPDAEARAREQGRFLADLRLVTNCLDQMLK